ncbi:MAG: hypothetical protein AAFS13_05025 [Pseudomonadota bacterium]
MEPISILLLVKIVGTLIPVALPLLFLPIATVNRLSGFEASDPVLYRLYGMAVLALLVGYAGGYFQVQDGTFPVGVVAMGFVSNAGACAVLLLTGRGFKAPWEPAFFGLIALGLAASFSFREQSMTPLW